MNKYQQKIKLRVRRSAMHDVPRQRQYCMHFTHGTDYKIKGIIVFVYLVAYNGNSRDQPHYQQTDNAYYNDNNDDDNDNDSRRSRFSFYALFLLLLKIAVTRIHTEGPAHRQNLIFFITFARSSAYYMRSCE